MLKTWNEQEFQSAQFTICTDESEVGSSASFEFRNPTPGQRAEYVEIETDSRGNMAEILDSLIEMLTEAAAALRAEQAHLDSQNQGQG